MFGWFNKKTDQIHFDEENKEQFTSLLTEIYEILRDSAYTAQADYIKDILFAVQKEDREMFKRKVISAELLGGAGSVIDVWIEEDNKMKKLDILINDFLELTVKSGLNHRYIRSRMVKKTNPNSI